MFPSLLIHALLIVGLPVATWHQRDVIREAVADVPRWMWGALLALLVLEFSMVSWWVPHNSWQTNMHGIGRIADVLDEGLLGASDMGRLHGMAWVVLMRMASMGSLGLISVPLTTHLMGTVALVGLFLFVGLSSKRWHWAMATVAVLAFHPVHLRLTASASPYVMVEMIVLWTLVWVELHLRVRTATTWLLAAGWQALAMQTHAEMLVLGPAFAGLYVLCRDPAWIPWAVRRAWFWAGLGLVALVVGPWLGEQIYGALVDIDVFAATGDMSDTLGRDRIRGIQLARLGTLWLLLMALLAVSAWVSRRDGLPDLGAWPRVGVALGALGLAAWCVPDPGPAWGGMVDFQVTPLGSERLVLARMHPFFDPTFGPDLWVALALLGVVVVGVWQWELAVFLVVGFAGSVLVTVGHYDAISTFLRVSMPALWFLSALAAAGVAGLLELVGTRAWAGGLALVLALVGGRDQWTWVTHRFPLQQEEDMIFAARQLASGHELATLLSTDQVDHPAAATLDFAFRNYVEQAFLRWDGGEVLGATELLEGSLSTERATYWLKLATCYRPVTPRAEAMGSSSVVDTQVWWIEGRLIEVPRFEDDGAFDGPGALNPDTQVWYQLDELAPCRGRPERMRCAERSEQDCDRWVCTDDTPPDHPFIDATCAEVERRFELEPVREERLAPGNLSRSQTLVATPGATIGLYRIVGPKEGTP